MHPTDMPLSQFTCQAMAGEGLSDSAAESLSQGCGSALTSRPFLGGCQERVPEVKEEPPDVAASDPEDESFGDDDSSSQLLLREQQERCQKGTYSCRGQGKHQCRFCPYTSWASDVTRHERTHTGEKPFTCDVCQQTFALKVTLRNHRRTHTGEKPFTCDVCQQTFSRKNSLRQHKRIHTGEKPFVCDICRQRFARKDQLVGHRKVHATEKP